MASVCRGVGSVQRVDTVGIQVDDGELDVTVVGEGPLVVFVPSLGRGKDDFDHLARACADAGFRAACPEPRGIGATTAPLANVTMERLAIDIAGVIDGLGASTAQIVGHAFGNRVARMTATEFPDRVDGVALLACGGAVQPAPEASAALLGVFDESLSPERHLDHVRTAFFAYGNDPAVWNDGWHTNVAMRQIIATREQEVEHWWEAGKAPVLIVHPSADVIAPIANAHDIVDRLGDRAELVTIANAGHALLPEQPDELASVLVDWLRRER